MNSTSEVQFKASKFVLWLVIVSVIMMFAGLTSGYIVRRAEGNWTLFEMPNMFWYTTVIILLSSVTIQLAYTTFKKGQTRTTGMLLFATLILGTAFLMGQWQAWKDLVAGGIYLSGNPSGSFLYIISGLHAAHIIAGLILIIYSYTGLYKNISEAKKNHRIELTLIFWHFVDILWIYLFVFLLLNR
jgi:cytochrome c oxidase subunit III